MLQRIMILSLEDISPDDKRRGELLNILLVGVALIASLILAFLTLARITGSIKYEAILFISTLTLLPGIFAIYWINQKGKVQLAGVIFLILISLAITYSDTPKELVVGRSLIFFIIPIMMASFLLRSYASFIVAALLTLEHLYLWNFTDVQADFSMFGMAAFFVFALITWLAANTLENALRESREINLKLDELVDERTAELAEAIVQLGSANERLTELDKLKSKFVSDVSHELRTPVSNISIYLEMAEDSLSAIEAIPERVMGFLKILRDETFRLSNLITDVLDLSRMEKEISEFKLQEVDAHKVIDDVFKANQLMAESKGLEFSFEPIASLHQIMAEPNQLKQVFTNLVGNAINYTPKGSVKISTLLRGDSEFLFRIQDTGIGIESEDLEHLFDRFYRGKQASLSSIPGTGLGLAITKEIIGAHNGSVDLESEVGVGTTITASFPLHRK